MAKYDATKNQRDITLEVFPEYVLLEPQFALELIWGIRNRLKRGQALKAADVAYLIDAFDKIINTVRLTGEKPSDPKDIGRAVARAFHLTRKGGRKNETFGRNFAIYNRVRMLVDSGKKQRAAIMQIVGENVEGWPSTYRGIEAVFQEQKRTYRDTMKDFAARISKAGTTNK